jgi:FkbH-like protein
VYESELNSKVESCEQLPLDVLQRFGELKSSVSERTVLSWSEHCTECAAPACFQSCELYQARPRDNKCRRFVEGMVRIDYPSGLAPYLLKISFKRWGALLAEANTRLYPVATADQRERWDLRIGAVIRALPLHRLPLPHRLRRKLVSKRYHEKRKRSRKPNFDGVLPDYFLMECFNPNDDVVRLTFQARSKEPGDDQRPRFQQLIEVRPGFHRERIPVADIAALIDLRRRFAISLVPNEITDGVALYFGMLDFVRDSAWANERRKSAERNAKDCKCVVWDLDNTIWKGVLIEDGRDALELRPGIIEVLRELDRRGIVHSIASKNDRDAALAVLQRFGILDYFVCPQISWSPKSGSVRNVARQLNIGLDTLIFIDDQPFEREEVSVVLPDIRTVDAAVYAQLPSRPDCQGSDTAEAANRRTLYRQQLERQLVEEQYGDEGYLDFLRECHIELEIHSMQPANLDRVHELAQRTNQLNFSGNRYTRDELQAILHNTNYDTYVLSCRDRFGDYGTVGFSIVDRREPRILDLAFSCRIQNKRVEHTFLVYLLEEHWQNGSTELWANYRKTDRNAPLGRVFDDLGFERQGETGGIWSLVFRGDKPIPDGGIVKIISRREETQVA